jgi:hypothetical protein
MTGEHNGLQKLIPDKYETALFVHFCSHQLNIVLRQSVKGIAECKLFFETSDFGALIFQNHQTG